MNILFVLGLFFISVLVHIALALPFAGPSYMKKSLLVFLFVCMAVACLIPSGLAYAYCFGALGTLYFLVLLNAQNSVSLFLLDKFQKSGERQILRSDLESLLNIELSCKARLEFLRKGGHVVVDENGLFSLSKKGQFIATATIRLRNLLGVEDCG